MSLLLVFHSSASDSSVSLNTNSDLQKKKGKLPDFVTETMVDEIAM